MTNDFAKYALMLLITSSISHARTLSWLEIINQSFDLSSNAPLTSTLIGLSGAAIAASSYYFYKKAKPKLMRTKAGFYISSRFNKMRYGADFTFNQIAGDPVNHDASLSNEGIFVNYDESGALRAINDGKKTPLVLTSIPKKEDHIAQLHKSFGGKGNESIEIATFNEPWECDVSGLTDLVNNNKAITQHRYPTPDFSAPSLIDLIRMVRDIENRDAQKCNVAAIHCKAGRGRSATGSGAYLIHVLHKAHKDATPEQVEAYLVAHRPQVNLTGDQKKALGNFMQALKTAGSFEKLCQQHQDEILLRDQEMGATA